MSETNEMNGTSERAGRHPEGLIHDYVDDELSASERSRIADHLAACPDCRALADSLLELRERARRAYGAAPEVEAADQWAGIEARIDARARARRHSSLAAAAVLTLLLGSGAALYGTLRGPAADAPDAAATPIASVPAASQQRPVIAIAAAYAPALSELEGILAAERDLLEPKTVATIDANLQILNQAIREIEAALAADPAHRGNLRSLEGMYQTKLGVLQQVVTLTSGD